MTFFSTASQGIIKTLSCQKIQDNKSAAPASRQAVDRVRVVGEGQVVLPRVRPELGREDHGGRISESRSRDRRDVRVGRFGRVNDEILLF